MTRSSREPRRMWVAPGRRAARRSRLRVACNCFTIYSETHYKTKRKQNVRRFLEWRVSACVSRVAALGFCTFMHHGVLSRTQTKNVRLSFLRQEVTSFCRETLLIVELTAPSRSRLGNKSRDINDPLPSRARQQAALVLCSQRPPNLVEGSG